MSGIGVPPPPDPKVEAQRRQWRAEDQARREIAREAARRASLNAVDRQREDIEQATYLAGVADAQAEATTDSARRSELQTVAAELRRKAKKLEKTMPPDIAIETPHKIRSDYATRSAAITADLLKLGQDDGLDRGWKSRERKRLLDALDVDRAKAESALAAWAAKSGAAAQKALTRDSRTPVQVSQDMGLELMSQRLSRTVSDPTSAHNILLGRAEQLLAAGDVLHARGYAMAAQIAGDPAANRLVADLEAAYQNEWEGRPEAKAALDAVQAEVRSWRIEVAASTARASRAAVVAASRIGDDADALSRNFVENSIAAKMAAQREALATGQPYHDPVGPAPEPAPVNPPPPSDRIVV